MTTDAIRKDGESGQPAVATVDAPAQQRTSADVEKELGKMGSIQSFDMLGGEPGPQGEEPGGTPETKPEEKAGDKKTAEQPAAKAEPEGMTEDQLKAEEARIAQGQKPSDKAFAFLRRRAKKADELESSVTELRTKMAELEQRMTAAPATATPAAAKSPPVKHDPGQIFQIHLNAINRVIDNAENVEKASRKIIDTMSSSDMLQVIDEAKAGKFGRDSDAVRQLVEAELPRAVARRDAERDRLEEATRFKADYEANVGKSISRMVEKFPELGDPKSDMFKFVPEFRDEFLGTFDDKGNVVKAGPFVEVLRHPDWPERLAPLIVAAFRAKKAGALEAELASLKKQVATRTSPETGQQGEPGSSSKVPSKSAEVEDRLRKLGKVSTL